MTQAELVQHSDVIARVVVLDNRRNPRFVKDWSNRAAERRKSTDMRLFYSWVATARVSVPRGSALEAKEQQEIALWEARRRK
jgi:hypothetical protein